MPITVNERYRSRSGEFGTTNYAEIKYVASGSDDIEEVIAAAEAKVPGEYNGLPLDTIAPDEITDGWWEVTARYRQNTGGDAQQVGEGRFRFDIGTTDQKITQSLATISKSGAVVTVPDFGSINFGTADYKGAINVTEDGSVQGTEIDTSVYEWEEDHVLAQASVTDAYINILFALSHSVNSDTFRGFAPGQVRLRGVRGSQRADGNFAMTFRFAALPNATNVAIGDITVPAKKGWDYLWVKYDEIHTTTSTGKNLFSQYPIQANVERVYDYAPYSQLNLSSPLPS